MEPWEKLLQKADASLKAAELLLQHEMLAFAVSRAYYAMFYATKALLLRRGIQPRTHRGVITAFGQHFVKTGIFAPHYHRWLLNALDQRLISDYELEVMLTIEEVETLLEQARDFLIGVKAYLESEM
ncbi:HEPN domain-containing protein [Rhodothermus marinus]|uniref:HEPN domain-containing protein n=1 Tax=Rhodothermus marinus TaxID=29549 RepID=UPI00396E08F5